MNKKSLVILALLLITVSAATIVFFGRTYTVKLDNSRLTDPVPEKTEDIRVEIEEDPAQAELVDMQIKDGVLLLTFHGLRAGHVHACVFFGEETETYFHLYVFPLGVITYETVFGDCTGDIVIPISVTVYLAAILWSLIKKLRADLRRSLYQYRNVMHLGMIIFLSFALLYQIPLFSYQGLLHTVNRLIYSAHAFSGFLLPAAFVLSVLITISNVTLLRKEGKTWRNMLGAILGVGLCLLTLLPFFLEEYLQRTSIPFLDVHKESGPALYIEIFTETFVSTLVSYLDCVLVGTVVFGIKAAKHIPAYDKDYILILGCQINADGTLPPLLRSRADKAVDFARRQKEKTGRDIFFVPSGGQGADESRAEAEAIKAYLVSAGIPAGRILPENTSANTEENIRNSMRLIRAHAENAEPKVAFSTTNYHVFRAGLLAQEQGEALEGIGSPTKRYFWLNAFVREFIATLVSERKKHMLVLLALTVIILVMVVIKYLSVVLL